MLAPPDPSPGRERRKENEMSKNNSIERLSEEVVLIDGKYYQSMTDEESAEFIWATSKIICECGHGVKLHTHHCGAPFCPCTKSVHQVVE
jgi:hypothetical protein